MYTLPITGTNPGFHGGGGVFARIFKMPVQNSNTKISAHPDLATQLLQVLIPAIFDSLLCQKGVC